LFTIGLAGALPLFMGCEGEDECANADPGDAAVDVTGTWAIRVSGDTDTWTLRQCGAGVRGANKDGGTITGSVSGTTFSGNMQSRDGQIVVTFEATVQGNTMSGTVNHVQLGSTSFTGTRQGV